MRWCDSSSTQQTAHTTPTPWSAHTTPAALPYPPPLTTMAMTMHVHAGASCVAARSATCRGHACRDACMSSTSGTKQQRACAALAGIRTPCTHAPRTHAPRTAATAVGGRMRADSARALHNRRLTRACARARRFDSQERMPCAFTSDAAVTSNGVRTPMGKHGGLALTRREGGGGQCVAKRTASTHTPITRDSTRMHTRTHTHTHTRARAQPHAAHP